MRAAICYEFGKPLVVEEATIDPPGAGEIKVRIDATAICHSDIHLIRGEWGGRTPVVAGHEAAGTVVQVGPEVINARVGDTVVVSLLRSCGRCFYCALGRPYDCEADFALNHEHRLHTLDGTPLVQGVYVGSFAEYAVVDQTQVVAIPPDMGADRACLLACGVITGLGAAVNTVHVEPGSSLVVIGTGGVGLNSIQGAVLSGAAKIVAVDILDSKLEAAKRFGATHIINSSRQDPVETVRQLTEGRGAEYVFVTVGNSKAITQGSHMMRKGGSMVLVGMPSNEDVSFAVDAHELVYGRSLVGSWMGSTRLSVDIPRLVALYQQRRLKLDELITGRYRLEEINEAIESMERGEALRNVIVF